MNFGDSLPHESEGIVWPTKEANEEAQSTVMSAGYRVGMGSAYAIVGGS